MNFSILHWFHLMFGNHTNCFAMQWQWVVRLWKMWRGNQRVPILHGISRKHYAMHATHFFIDQSGVPQTWATLDRKSTLFKLIVKFFLKGVVFMFWHDIVYIELLYCVTKFELVWTWNKVAVVGNATSVDCTPPSPNPKLHYIFLEHVPSVISGPIIFGFPTTIFFTTKLFLRSVTHSAYKFYAWYHLRLFLGGNFICP